MTILLQIPQQLKTSWFTVTAFNGFSLIALIILVLSLLDSMRIRSDITPIQIRQKRRRRKEQKEQEDSLNLSQTANLGSDITLPEDYFMSNNCSSGYGSTIINDTIQEEEEISRDQDDNQQEIEIKRWPERTQENHALEE